MGWIGREKEERGKPCESVGTETKLCRYEVGKKGKRKNE